MADDPDIHEASGGGVVVGTLTLPPGAQVTTLGHIVSAASNHVVLDDTPYTIGASQGASIPLIQGSNPSFYEAADGGVVLKNTTLLPGAQITYSSHTLSVGSGIVAIDGTPYLLSATPRTSIPLLHEASDGGLVLGSTTLPPGVQTTHSSHVISVGSGTVVVDDDPYTWSAGASLELAKDASRSSPSGPISLAIGTTAANKLGEEQGSTFT